MYVEGMVPMLESYLSGDHKEEIADQLLHAFDLLIRSAANGSYTARVCGSKREWRAEAQFWFFEYLVKYDPQKHGRSLAAFPHYMRTCLRARLHYVKQQRTDYYRRNFLANLSATGGTEVASSSAAQRENWPSRLVTVIHDQAAQSAENEYLAPIATADIERFEDEILSEMRDSCPDRHYAIFGSHYAGKTETTGVVQVKTLAELFGIGCSRVNQIRAEAKAQMFRAAARVSIKRLASLPARAPDATDAHLASGAFLTITRAFERYGA